MHLAGTGRGAQTCGQLHRRAEQIVVVVGDGLASTPMSRRRSAATLRSSGDAQSRDVPRRPVRRATRPRPAPTRARQPSRSDRHRGNATVATTELNAAMMPSPVCLTSRPSCAVSALPDDLVAARRAVAYGRRRRADTVWADPHTSANDRPTWRHRRRLRERAAPDERVREVAVASTPHRPPQAVRLPGASMAWRFGPSARQNTVPLSGSNQYVWNRTACLSCDRDVAAMSSVRPDPITDAFAVDDDVSSNDSSVDVIGRSEPTAEYHVVDHVGRGVGFPEFVGRQRAEVDVGREQLAQHARVLGGEGSRELFTDRHDHSRHLCAAIGAAPEVRRGQPAAMGLTSTCALIATRSGRDRNSATTDRQSLARSPSSATIASSSSASAGSSSVTRRSALAGSSATRRARGTRRDGT